MKYYSSYMDRQQVSPEIHQRLLSLEPPKPNTGKKHALRFAALAACCVLAAGIGLRQWNGNTRPPVTPSAALSTPFEDTSSTHASSSSPSGFAADSSADSEKMMLPMIPYVAYPDLTNQPAADYSIALPEGSFAVDLTLEDISILLWGGQEQMERAHIKQQSEGSIPWLLFWDGYTISGKARYDGQGQLWQANIQGIKDESHSFSLTLAPGHLPPTCCVSMGAEITQVRDVEITSWKTYYDRNGDGQKEHVYESAFLAHDVGVRFTSITQEDSTLSSLLVNWCTYSNGGLSLEHLMTCENIPAWEEKGLDTLAQARDESGFTSYLPLSGPSGYPEFSGHLSYQEGTNHTLAVRWSRGYDDVSIAIHLAEGDSNSLPTPVDVKNPASYDTRLYTIPWCDSVPSEYQTDFYCPTFRAEDMSLEVIQARAIEKDTGGLSYHFQVLHPDHTLVTYGCDGLSAQQVWQLVSPTLASQIDPVNS